MPRIAITELWLKHAHNRVTDRPVEFTHDGVDFELGVVVNPASKRYPKGTKTYFTRYPFPGTKRGRRQTLGRYPTVKLSEALEQAKEAQRQAGRGVDPRQAPRQARQHLTFAELFEKYFEERSLKKTRPGKDRSAYNLYLRDWADHLARDITRQMARDSNYSPNPSSRCDPSSRVAPAKGAKGKPEKRCSKSQAVEGLPGSVLEAQLTLAAELCGSSRRRHCCGAGPARVRSTAG